MTVIDLNRGDALALQRERKPRFVLYRELEAESRKEWLVKDLLGAGDASAFYGVPGCGKSVLVEDMALHIAADREWHGRQVKPGAVLYVALERKKLVERRAIAFREKHGITDLPFAVLGGMYNLREPGAGVAIAAAAKQFEKYLASLLSSSPLTPSRAPYAVGTKIRPRIWAQSSPPRLDYRKTPKPTSHGPTTCPKTGQRTQGTRCVARGNGHHHSRRKAI